jgi:hypothetical protein
VERHMVVHNLKLNEENEQNEFLLERIKKNHNCS